MSTNVNLTRGFSVIAFRCHPSHFRELLLGFYTRFILSAQLIAEWFGILSSELFWAFPSQFYRKCYGFERAFFTAQVFFTLHFFPTFWYVFVTQMWAEAPHPESCSVPTLSELSLPADAWSWTTHIVDTRPFAYQLCQWATIESKLNYLICFNQPILFQRL